MGDRFATVDKGQKSGEAAVPLSEGGELGLHLTQCGLGRSLPPTKWQPFGHNTPTLQTDRQDRQRCVGPIA